MYTTEHQQRVKERDVRSCLAGLLLAGACGLSIVGCHALPHAEVNAAREIGAATGVGEAIEFVFVGPDGAPLDELEATDSTLPLSDAVRRAVTTDPSLQAALARIRIAMADAQQSRLLPNPVLNVALRWGPGKPQVEASLAQDFIQAIQIPGRSSATDNRLREAASSAVTVALDVASEVQERYVNVQAAAAVTPIFRARLALLEQLASVAKARLDAGEGTRSDLATLDAQRVEMEVEIDQALLAEREERVRLARLIGHPSSSANWTLESWMPVELDSQSESRWVEAALTHRPELQAIHWRLAALGDDAALVGLARWDGASAGLDVSRDDKWFAGPAMSAPIPIFDTGQARRARVIAEQLEARHDLSLARRKVVEEVRVAYQTIAASTANLARIRDELIPLQEKRRELAESAYRAGQTDVTALYLAEQDLRLSQARAIGVEQQAVTSLIRLHRAVGGAGVARKVVEGNQP